jgi:hypothetical protein
MTKNVQGSAKIYQFPVRARVTGDDRPIEPTPDSRSIEVATVAGGSGWYHELAIQDSRRANER